MTEINQFHTNLFREYTIYKLDNNEEISNSVNPNIHTLIYIPENCSTQDIEQVDKILSACQLDNQQVLILKSLIPWRQLRAYQHIKTILLFDVKPSAIQVDIQIPLHYPLQFDERTWIATIHPSQMQSDPNAKASLWKNALKPHFIGS